MCQKFTFLICSTPFIYKRSKFRFKSKIVLDSTFRIDAGNDGSKIPLSE